MYTPRQFHESIFAAGAGQDGLVANRLPFLLDAERGARSLFDWYSS